MPKKLFTIIILIEAIIGGFALAYIFSAYWNKPLGPGLEIPTQVSSLVDSSPIHSVKNLQSGESFAESTPTPSSLLDQISTLLKPPSESVQPLCGGPPYITILVVGSDARENGYLYGLADSIRIVRIDFTVPKVMILDIPRDLWVDIPGISDHYGITQGKINQAYFFGNPGMGYYDGPGEGPGLLARTLDLNYGLHVDHYLAVDRKTFVDFINAVGGIDMQLNSLIDMNEGQDGANPNLVLNAGYQHLDGDMALKLASSRIPSIFQRARNQNIILRSLQDKLLYPSMIPELSKLASQFLGSVQTDLSLNNINQLICVGQKVTQENTHIVSIPDEMFIAGSTYDPYRQVNTYTLSVDMGLFKEYMVDFMQGTWPKD
jgi:LCP family protein required for cell wall assembly